MTVRTSSVARSPLGRSNHLVLKTAFLLVLILLLTSSLSADQAQVETTRWNVRVESIASDQMSLDIKGGTTGPNHKSGGFDHLIVRDASLKEQVKQLQKGDVITLVYAEVGNQKELRIFSVDAASTAPRTVAWVFLASAGICFLLYYLLSGLHPLRLIIGEDGRYSNSKFQITLWFAVLITTYISAIWLRWWWAGSDFIGGVNIPQNLLLVSGISAFTFGAAKAITANKVEQAQANGIADPKDSVHAKADFFLDLTHSDVPAGRVAGRALDLGDFQMLVITLLAVAVYLVLVLHFLGTIEKTRTVSLPDLDTTILAAFGLGHGAYLTKKAAGTVGQS